MKSIRLTKDLRESIAHSMAKGFEENYFKHFNTKTGNELAAKVEESLKEAMIVAWKGKYGKHAIHLANIPPKLLKSEPFRIKVNSEVICLTLDKMPGTGAVDVVFEEEAYNVIFKDYLYLRTQLAVWKKERDTFKGEITPILESFSTTKQLIEAWPSAEQYLPPNISDPDKGIKLPMLALSRLEEKLGVK